MLDAWAEFEREQLSRMIGRREAALTMCSFCPALFTPQIQPREYFLPSGIATDSAAPKAKHSKMVTLLNYRLKVTL